MNYDVKVEELMAREAWQRAHDLIFRRVATGTRDHWLLCQLSSCLYELRRYPEAMAAAQAALALEPACTLALWHRCGALYMLDREEECMLDCAMIVALLKSGAGCSEGAGWADSLRRDALARLRACLEVVQRGAWRRS